MKKRVVIWLGGVVLCCAIVFGTTHELITSPLGVFDTPSKRAEIPKWALHLDQPVQPHGRLPVMRCEAALIVDNVNNDVLLAQSALEKRPIASLSKLLTSLVFVESGVDLSTIAQVTKDDAFESSRSHFRPGDKLALRDFLYATLVSSDNRAARVLARSAGMTSDAFVARMNDMAHELGMDSTHVVEPTGLSQDNVSNARDCAIALNTVLKNPLLRQIASTPDTTVRCLNRRRLYHLVNTNRLLRGGFRFVGSKTGYIDAAGWCIAARSAADDGHDVTVVVLGAPSNSNRFRALRNALKWANSLPLSADTGS
jgi:D-alanyl-D-alanine endopeptidase (penicillin-binding protein 7)